MAVHCLPVHPPLKPALFADHVYVDAPEQIAVNVIVSPMIAAGSWGLLTVRALHESAAATVTVPAGTVVQDDEPLQACTV